MLPFAASVPSAVESEVKANETEAILSVQWTLSVRLPCVSVWIIEDVTPFFGKLSSFVSDSSPCDLRSPLSILLRCATSLSVEFMMTESGLADTPECALRVDDLATWFSFEMADFSLNKPPPRAVSVLLPLSLKFLSSFENNLSNSQTENRVKFSVFVSFVDVCLSMHDCALVFELFSNFREAALFSGCLLKAGRLNQIRCLDEMQRVIDEALANYPQAAVLVPAPKPNTFHKPFHQVWFGAVHSVWLVSSVLSQRSVLGGLEISGLTFMAFNDLPGVDMPVFKVLSARFVATYQQGHELPLGAYHCSTSVSIDTWQPSASAWIPLVERTHIGLECDLRALGEIRMMVCV